MKSLFRLIGTIFGMAGLEKTLRRYGTLGMNVSAAVPPFVELLKKSLAAIPDGITPVEARSLRDQLRLARVPLDNAINAIENELTRIAGPVEPPPSPRRQPRRGRPPSNPTS